MTAGGGLWRRPGGDASCAAQPCREFLLACYRGIKKNGEQHWRDSVNSSKAEEIRDVRGWPSDIFINTWHQEIKVSNGEGEPSLQKTAGSAYRQQRSVSETYAISSHNKSIINASI